MAEDEADQVFAFWTAPIGGFALALLLTFPAECTGDILNRQCTNILGSEALVLDQAQSWLLGVIVGAVFWAAVKAYRHLTRDGSAPPPLA